MHNEPQNSNLSMLLLVLPVVVIWGCNFAVMKVGVSAVGPFLLAAMRFFIASFPLIFFVARPRLPVSYIIIFSFTFGLGQFGLLFMAIKLGLPSGMASLLVQLQAVFTPILSWMMLGNTITKSTTVAILTSFLGLGVIVSGGFNGVVVLTPLTLGVGAAMSWAASNVTVSFASARGYSYNPVSLVVWASALLPIPFFALAMVSGELKNITALDIITAVPAVLYLGIIATIVAYHFWVKAISIYQASNVAPFSLLIPIIGLFVGWIVFGETLSKTEAIGSALVLTGVLVHTFSKPAG